MTHYKKDILRYCAQINDGDSKFKMFHIKALLFVSILLPLAKSIPDAARPREKRSANYYSVDGCFSSFPSPGISKDLGSDNSNVKCQDTCRDESYILAATKGSQCHCGNIYPKDNKVNDDQCTTKCRSWTPCYGTQSCCGGPNAYSVSVVGNIDVAKQVLRRLSHEWQTNEDYRNYMKSQVKISNPETQKADWQTALDHRGWALCENGKYMTGMWRNRYQSGDEGIGRIEFAECRDAPSYLYPAKDFQDCYNHDWGTSFDHPGWSTCSKGYYMTGLYNSGGPRLGNIEEAKCCRSKSQVKQWGHCYNHNVASAFDREGWSKCNSGYYMAGLYKSDCQRLGCIEHFKCCKMGEYNGESWLEKPDLVIKVKDASGQQKDCSMNAMDKSASSSTYQCESLSDDTDMLELKALKFDIEDTTPLDVAKPEPIKGFRPVICSSNPTSYKCRKLLSVEVSTSSTMLIGSGFSMAVNVGSSVEIGAGFLGTGAKSTFSTEISSTSSFNVESSTTNTYTTTDNTDVSVEVPPNTEIMINYLRTVRDLEYKWKAVFELLGIYSIRWKNGHKEPQDVTTVLTGSKREMFSFGSWRYPDTDVLRVVFTDKYGKEKGSGCEHKAGETNSCNL